MKLSNWLTNVVLLVLVVALSLLTYITNTKNKTNSIIPSLTTLDPQLVSTIKINKNDNQTVLNKQNNEWRIIQPIEVKANQLRVGSLLKLLTINIYAQYPIEDIDLSQYGLSDSVLNIEIDNTRIRFGSTNPINDKRYILINNNMYLIEDNFFPLINSQLGTLVDHRLFPDDSEMTKIQTGNFSLTKNDKGHWVSSNNASSDKINKTVTYWKNAQSFGVHDYVQRKTLEDISITFNNSKASTRLIVTDKEPWLIIARPELGLEYHFDETYIDKLLSTEYNDSTIEDDR